MEISLRDLLTVLHGIGFGAILLLAFPVMLVELTRMSTAGGRGPSRREHQLLLLCLSGMAGLAWVTVFMGAYVIYPWYRAKPPAGITDLAGYPQRLLMSSPKTTGWHGLGMEWKEHVAWFAPIALTMVAYVFAKYGSALFKQRQIRAAVLTFAVVAFLAAGVAGAFGAFLNKFAPVRGGSIIQIMSEKSR
jgi:hypothetical protein